MTTLNLLCSSQLNPRLSTEEHLKGTFNFKNRMPMASLGTGIAMHDKPNRQRSWDIHGQDGWYISPAPEHYCCYQIYVTKTAATRFTDTIKFFPSICNMPRTSSSNAATFTANIQPPRHHSPNIVIAKNKCSNNLQLFLKRPSQNRLPQNQHPAEL